MKKRIKQLKAKTAKKKSKEKNGGKKRTLYQKIKEEVIQPIETWTLHALPNVVRSKYMSVKIIWMIIFLAAVGVSIYFVVSTVREFLRYDVTSLVRSIAVDELDLSVLN